MGFTKGSAIFILGRHLTASGQRMRPFWGIIRLLFLIQWSIIVHSQLPRWTLDLVKGSCFLMFAVLSGLLPTFQISECKITVFPKLWPTEVWEEPMTPSTSKTAVQQPGCIRNSENYIILCKCWLTDRPGSPGWPASPFIPWRPCNFHKWLRNTSDFQYTRCRSIQRSNLLPFTTSLPSKPQHCSTNVQSKSICAKLDNTIFIFYSGLHNNPALTTGTNQKMCKHRLRTWIANDTKNESTWFESALNSYSLKKFHECWCFHFSDFFKWMWQINVLFVLHM